MNMMINPIMMQNTINSGVMGILNKPGDYRKVWVGHIPPVLSDTFILKLLETCGSVATWKRTTDHMGRAKGFGLCEYHTVESMLKCLRLLNHLKLEEGYELSVI
jgi:RNA recognition motif-containing protein